MAEHPPTPSQTDNSFTVGATKKSLDADTCNCVYFYAQTYRGGEPFRHNLWFHESWSAFGAPMNILFAERDGKPTVLVLLDPPQGSPKSEFQYDDVMEFYHTRPERPQREPHGGPYADAPRSSAFRLPLNRARRMFRGIRIPTLRVPPCWWWREKFNLLLKALIILMVIAFALEAVSHAPKLQEIIRAKFAPANQASRHGEDFNAGGDFINSDRNQSDNDRENLNTDRDSVKTAKDNPETNRDRTKTDHGQFNFERSADGNHIHGTWTEPDDTQVTVDASKTPRGDSPVTEIKFMRSEEQFIKDENEVVLFSLNRITRFLVTLIGGEDHDEKLAKVSECV